MADVTDPTAALDVLVALVKKLGVKVHFVARRQHDHEAKYEGPEDGGPAITVWCNAESTAEIQRRASLLAHECGHHLSSVAGWRTQAYLAADHRRKNWCNFELTPREIALILHEESLAWRIGQAMLQACGVELSDFEAHRRVGLERYCDNMAVKPAAARRNALDEADKLALHHLYETLAGEKLLALLGTPSP